MQTPRHLAFERQDEIAHISRDGAHADLPTLLLLRLRTLFLLKLCTPFFTVCYLLAFIVGDQ
jgi:hypothetical protein